MKQNKLIRLYKHKITPFERSFDELVSYLKEILDVDEIDLSEVSPTYLFTMGQNVIWGNPENITPEDVKFHAFRVVENEKSEEYYDGNRRLFAPEDWPIIVLLEENTKFVAANCGKLEIALEKAYGISQYDYDNDTVKLLAYLSLFDTSRFKGHIL